MIFQDRIWAIALFGIGLVALVFIYVVREARHGPGSAPPEQSARVVRRLQATLFFVLLAVFVVGTWATLREFPIPAQHAALDARQTVDVEGRMWSWKITPARVAANQSVEFRVTSADVNHGFGIYAPDGNMVMQTQAMPGYTNKILYTFTQPGTYTVHCLEYCGVGHAPMKATFQVVAAGE